MKDKLGFVVGGLSAAAILESVEWKGWKKIIFCSLLILVGGCDFVEPPEDVGMEVVEKEEENVKVLDPLSVISDWKLKTGDGVAIEKDTFVDEVKAGDKIFITIRGLWGKRSFSPVYEKKGTSSWNMPPSPKERRKLSPVKPVPERSYGRCTARFRDYKFESAPLFFTGNPWEYPIRFKIGEVRYPLGDVIEEGHEASLVFRVREDMLEDSNELHLVVEQGESRHVRVGFIEYGDCDGGKWDGFRTGHNTNFKFVPDGDKYYFFVSWRKEERQ